MSAAHPLRVLVIDDDEVMTELLSAVLGMEGYDVVTAGSGEAALELLRGQSFDVVLTDLQLPGLRGHELAKALRLALADSKSSTRFLGMSGSEPSEQERSDFDAFLLKPFTAEQFSEAAAGSSAASSEVPPAKPSSSPLDESIYAQLSKQLPKDKLHELLQLTLSDSRMRLRRIEQALADDDLDTVRREAHAIKGGTGMVGASELYKLAAQAENAAAKGSTAGTPPLADFYAACNRLESMLSTRLTDT